MAKKLKVTKPSEPKPSGPADYLRTWSTLLEYLRTAAEKELWGLLEYEVKHRKRMPFALRIYGKAAEARSIREKREMAASISK